MYQERRPICISNRITKSLMLLALVLASALARAPVEADEGSSRLTIVGRAVDSHDRPLAGVAVKALLSAPQGEGPPAQLGAAESTSDGSYVLRVELAASIIGGLRAGQRKLRLQCTKPGYGDAILEVSEAQVIGEGQRYYIELREAVLPPIANAAFVIATISFLLVLLSLFLSLLHKTTAALVGAMLVLITTYTLGQFNPDFYILDFERAVHYIDFNVIFLLLGMMVLAAVIGRTGFFQWLAFTAFKATRGRTFILVAVLTLFTAVSSSLLDVVTVILLIVPVSIELAILLGLNPVCLIIPLIFAGNIGGAATVAGEPPNVIIASYAKLGFSDFVANMGPVSLTMVVVALIMFRFIYRREYAEASTDISPDLMKRLEEDTRITDPAALKKGLLALFVVVVLFIFGKQLHMPTGVAALLGATILLTWLRPNVHEMLGEVDWTTLVFFIALFIVVGGLEEVGLLAMLADAIKEVAGDNLSLASGLMIWISGTASGFLDNIPFTAAALPIASFLTRAIPGAESNVLYYALSVAACYGGNMTSIGSASAVVALGILERAGYRMTFSRYLRVALPVTLVILVLSTVWMLARY